MARYRVLARDQPHILSPVSVQPIVRGPEASKVVRQRCAKNALIRRTKLASVTRNTHEYTRRPVDREDTRNSGHPDHCSHDTFHWSVRVLDISYGGSICVAAKRNRRGEASGFCRTT